LHQSENESYRNVQIISKLSAIMVTMVTTLMRLHSVYQAEDHNMPA